MIEAIHKSLQRVHAAEVRHLRHQRSDLKKQAISLAAEIDQINIQIEDLLAQMDGPSIASINTMTADEAEVILRAAEAHRAADRAWRQVSGQHAPESTAQVPDYDDEPFDMRY